MLNSIFQKPAKAARKTSVLFAFAVIASVSAHADDYGCQVLLCLATPGSPTTYSQCVPPITRLWNDLLAIPPRPFPQCALANGGGGGSRVLQRRVEPFEPCPTNTVWLGPDPSRYTLPSFTQLSIAPGEASTDTDGNPRASARVCGVSPQGMKTLTLRNNNDDGFDMISVPGFMSVVFPARETASIILDVYIDGKLHNTVKYPQ